jgi:hypothetical protein
MAHTTAARRSPPERPGSYQIRRLPALAPPAELPCGPRGTPWRRSSPTARTRSLRLTMLELHEREHKQLGHDRAQLPPSCARGAITTRRPLFPSLTTTQPGTAAAFLIEKRRGPKGWNRRMMNFFDRSGSQAVCRAAFLFGRADACTGSLRQRTTQGETS